MSTTRTRRVWRGQRYLDRVGYIGVSELDQNLHDVVQYVIDQYGLETLDKLLQMSGFEIKITADKGRVYTLEVDPDVAPT